MGNKLNIFNDDRGGYLIPFEFINLPFLPKRIFTVTDVPKDGLRGEHAHYNTQQILICIKGEIMVYLDYGYKYEEILLRKGEHVFIDKLVWDSQRFLTGDDFMVVISSTHYEISDYILNKEEFYKKINKK
jgi:hypothetical protein